MTDVGFDASGGVYTAWTEHVSLSFDRLRWDRYGQLGAEVTATLTFPEERQLHSAWATLTTTTGRKTLVKELAERCREEPWAEIIETACVRVRDRFRLGEPAVLIGDAPDIEPGDAQLRDSLTGDVLLPRNEFTILFGDGDTGKSMAALLFAALIHAGRSDIANLEAKGARVGYADWETSAGIQKSRLKRMFGESYPKDLVYIPGGGIPLPDSVDRLRRIVARERIGYLFIDSIAYACGGPPEDASVAASFLNALQQLGLGSRLGVCAIAHVTKADARAQADKPFGSAFWANSARMTWYAKRNEGNGDNYTIGLFNKKANLGPRSRAIGLTLDYANDGLAFDRSDVVADPELGAQVSLSVRIHRLLLQSRRAMTYAEIGDELDADHKVVAETCRRGIGSLFSKAPGEAREVRIGLHAVERAA
jgi:hypothetical protein